MKNNKVKEIKKDETKEKEENNNWIPFGMCIGMCIGVAIGAATKNISMWLPIGLCLGLGLGAAFSNNNDKEK